MQLPAIGRSLRTRRTAAARTVASVAADAGLSVPYIANLENGRGNPTISALERIAKALDMRLNIILQPIAGGDDAGNPATQATATHPTTVPPSIPATLVRLGRTERFRRTAIACSDSLGTDAGQFTDRLVSALATVADTLDRDLDEADWWRLLDALLLIATHPNTDRHRQPFPAR